MATNRWLELVPLLERAVEPAPSGGGLHGVAVLSPGGEPVGIAGALASYEVRALAALVSREGPPDLLRELFEGELVTTAYDQRLLFLGIAGRCVFVIALADDDFSLARESASDLRDSIEQLIRDSRGRLGAGWVPADPGSDGSSSPAQAFAWPSRPRGPGGNN